LAFDDPVVWIMIIALAVFFFGSGKIPQFAKALGEAKREFDSAWRGFGSMTAPLTQPPAPVAPRPATTTFMPPQAPAQPPPLTQEPAPAPTLPVVSSTDPLIVAAKNEGIVTEGKTREQVATELAIKLNNSKHAAETSG